ncbi:hypothetical protein HRR83_003353 [Exophiala dermatitidis]|uniref:Uncharacterized protein n=2 Tax=Eurotiomycetes TaxID=147545 RepID=A0A3A2ZHE5_9EURO|nr:hypothetical protein HRR74_004489 [Exophiala dermatitidis]RJE17315.1 hypothetical protein PHISCL_10348 [Aspergillus sclerotialis]KAJ4521092.1 hypothetical protein HRR73_003433 [Exophiala dermatitidis]KAJ4547676.1 hypothetical protein HRR76_000307 [Exophiala dermatitidis]KAJ4553614.1 hypothetical protein HRR77_001995 [Exophiala dermatitidis]
MPRYHSSSGSSSGAERIYYNSRREDRNGKEPRPVTKREVVIINYPNTATQDDIVRTSGMTNNRWK